MHSYLNLLQDVYLNGEGHDDRTGVGTRSVFGRQWRHCLRDGFPLLTTKKMPFRWIAEELRWFLSGSTNEKDLQKVGVDIWKEWATEEQCAKFGRREGDLGPVYGALWREFPIGESRYDDQRALTVMVGPDGQEHRRIATDQITWLMNELNTNPKSRRLLVTGWHPFYQSRVALPPCHTLWQVKVHDDDSLSLHLYARSIDAFLGLPFNIASYALLCSLIAITSGRKPRDVVISFGDLHIYNSHIKAVETQLEREPRRLPTLTINPRLHGTEIAGLLSWTMDDLILTHYDPLPKISAPVAV